MQDIISTLKNALQQAEAGLEVAVCRLAKDGTERGDFKPSEVLALACVREALAMPVSCLHQIQEPAAAEQAAWHAGLDEGRAQATGSVSNATSQAAPAAVNPSETPNSSTIAVPSGWKLVPDDATPEWVENLEALPDWRDAVGECIKKFLAASPVAPQAAPAAVAVPDGWKLVPVACTNEICCAIEREIDSQLAASGIAGPMHRQDGAEIWNAALAATPAAAPVVLPEPDINTANHVGIRVVGYTEQQVRALLATATGLPAQAVASIYVTEDGQRECEDWKVPLPVGRNLLYAAPQVQADARDAGRWRMASLIHSEMMKHPDIRAEPEAASAYMNAVHNGVCFEAAIDAAIAAAKGE